jgi:DNA polymerase
MTNVVKHFKWTASGSVRKHAKPNAREIRACRPWLEEEIRNVHPRVLVCLGATAAQALLGASFRVTTQRGRWFETPFAARVLATIHPSAILRQRTDDDRHREMAAFVRDLGVAAKELVGG